MCVTVSVCVPPLSQVFCVLLWMLDDMWYYSVMTLAMLVFVEVTVINQRIRNAASLSSMRRQHTILQVCRDVRPQPPPAPGTRLLVDSS